MSNKKVAKEQNGNKFHSNMLNQDNKTQGENLIEMLTKSTYECMVCCDRIKPAHAIWSCEKCFNCFHLGCIKKWAGASQGGKCILDKNN